MATVDSTQSIAENYTKYAQYFETETNDLANAETFYKLLLAEMTNQDPMEPTSNTEFISQLASFSSLQNQTNALTYQQSAYATSLAGKTVTIASSTGTGLAVDTGVVTSVDLSDGDNIEVTVNGKRYALKYVMAVNSDETASASSNTSSSDGAYATSLVGKQVTVLEDGVADQGVVEAIQVENGEFSVVINDLAYSLGSVVRVKNVEEDTVIVEDAFDPAVETTILPIDTTYINGAYATSLIGKQVTIDNGIVNQQGLVEYIEISDGAFKVVVNEIPYDLSAVVRVADPADISETEGDAETGLIESADGEETVTDAVEDGSTAVEDSDLTDEGNAADDVTVIPTDDDTSNGWLEVGEDEEDVPDLVDGSEDREILELFS